MGSVYTDRAGETQMMRCGMSATIIIYRSSVDIDVQFEDKTIVRNKNYTDFKNGRIQNPNIKRIYGRRSEDRTGETRLMNCGMQATIIAYRGVLDIDIQFEDRKVVKNRGYFDFIKGKIRNPNIDKDRLGETRTMNCGMQATIIEYRGFADIDIQFEDGTIVKNKRYESFKKGKIRNPNYPNLSRSHIIDRIGETRTMNCGMTATIIEYRSVIDIDIKFEDDTIVKNRRYGNFSRGHIAYPNKSINNIEIGSEVYRMKSRVYYNCACQKCHANMILTPQEMLQHHC